MKCSKKGCKNKDTMNCLGCKWNESLRKQDKCWDSYNNKYKTY